jgi:hypothetical protein
LTKRKIAQVTGLVGPGRGNCNFHSYLVIRNIDILYIVDELALTVKKLLHELEKNSFERLFVATSEQARLPAKFKHINKRRKRN